MNERFYRLAAVVRADVLIRMRRPSTAVVFVLLSFIPYMWIPDPSTGRTLINIAGQRALYNSAAIGMATAVLGTMFIGMAGFYVISNAVKRDVLSRCGFVIASTTMRGSEYIIGKFAGNVVFLSLFTLGFMATAMAMVLVRGEAPLEPLVFARQYLLLVPPAIFCVSAMAILFECTPLLRTKFGDVLYFFIWAGLMGTVATMTEKGAGGWAAYFDVSGLGFLLQQLKTNYNTDALSIGASTFDAAKPVLVFPGLQWGWQWVMPRLVSTLWPMLLLVVARVFFHRFDPARVRSMPNEKARASWIGRFNMMSKPIARLIVRIGNAVAALPGVPLLARTAMTDALATIAQFPLASIAMIGFSLASLGTDMKSLFEGVLPFAFAACAITLADIACREKRAGTTALIYATPGLRARFVAWKFASTLLVAIAFLGIPIARAIALRPASALPLLVSIAFLSAASTALGILSSNPKTFIVAFLTFWYIALSDKGASPALDFAGWFGKTTPAVSVAYAAIAIAFLTLAQLFHVWELRRKW
ncbi:MAG TPA: hypothetical protein VFV49_06475 [Thermoanaerobaculia bacterium]|nr:hypothetical protein [Thermoanaerobaculia bacterium]